MAAPRRTPIHRAEPPACPFESCKGPLCRPPYASSARHCLCAALAKWDDGANPAREWVAAAYASGSISELERSRANSFITTWSRTSTSFGLARFSKTASQPSRQQSSVSTVTTSASRMSAGILPSYSFNALSNSVSRFIVRLRDWWSRAW